MDEDMKKLKALLPHWLEHSEEHIKDNEKWLKRAKEAGFDDVAEGIEKIIALSKESGHHI